MGWCVLLAGKYDNFIDFKLQFANMPGADV